MKNLALMHIFFLLTNEFARTGGLDDRDLWMILPTLLLGSPPKSQYDKYDQANVRLFLPWLFSNQLITPSLFFWTHHCCYGYMHRWIPKGRVKSTKSFRSQCILCHTLWSKNRENDNNHHASPSEIESRCGSTRRNSSHQPAIIRK